MKIKFILFVIILFHCSGTICQTGEKKYFEADEDIIGKLITGVKKDDSIIKGIFYGISGDSLYLQVERKVVAFPISVFKRISIYKKSSQTGFAVGLTSGMYLGTLIFLGADQGAKFLEHNNKFGLILMEAVFVVVGGGLGYLIDRTSLNEFETFYFEGDEGFIIKETTRFREFISKKRERKLVISVYLSQLNTRDIKREDNHYFFSTENSIKSFNLLRRMAITYRIFHVFEAGVSINWLAEPHYHSFYERYALDERYNGMGYYAAFNFLPFRDILSENMEIVLGGGIGIASLDYQLNFFEVYGYAQTTTKKEIFINKSYFSSFLSAEFRLRLVSEVSIAAQFDYVYIPGKRDAIPQVNVEERALGNVGYGIGLIYKF
jgi:hypothetical protein